MNHLNKLLKKLDNNSCSIEELEKLKQLLDDNKLSKKYFKKQYQKEIPQKINKTISKNLWQQIDNKIETNPKRINIKRVIGIAASILLLISVGLFSNYSNKKTQWVFVQNTSHKVKKITLPDSSSVWLAAQSSFSYSKDFNKQKRETKLTGQAFFEVTKNKKSPFTILTGDIITKVLGTSFNIKSQDTLVEVVVATGIVKVSSKKEAIQLLPNDKAVYYAKSSLLKKSTTFSKLHTLWFKESIVLDRISIKELIPVLEEKYNTSIFFGDEKSKTAVLYSFRLSNNEKLDQIIKRINYINEVQLKSNRNGIEITTK